MDLLDRSFEVKEVTDSGTFAGYGNVYGVVDQGDDIVAHDCFAESLSTMKAQKRMPALLWQHKASEPIGVYQNVYEDPKGLYVEGKLAMKTARGAEAYELLKMNALSGLSIGFETKEATHDQKSGVRTIQKGILWECSLVTFPMNDLARVSAVKMIEEIEDLSGAERYLREAGGVSRSEAKAMVSRIFNLARREADSLKAESADALVAVFDRRFKAAMPAAASPAAMAAYDCTMDPCPMKADASMKQCPKPNCPMKAMMPAKMP